MYKTQGITTKITATSRAAIKCKDNFFTVEATEERIIPDDGIIQVDMDKEWSALFDSVNAIIDNQVEDIYEANKK